MRLRKVDMSQKLMRSSKMMTDFQVVFEGLNQGDSFKRIKSENESIAVFCGLRENNLPSIAFMTKTPPILIESTQCIKVSQWQEKDDIYWSSLDLQLANARSIFYALCFDLFEVTNETKTDTQAMIAIKNRYLMWRKLFRKVKSPMSFEEYQGLYGELYFLCNYLLKRYDADTAVKSWSGANKTAKDFSINSDWYEVKTISTNSSEIRISSLTQLEADTPGKLVVNRVEKMSDEYSDGCSTVDELVSLIIRAINDDETRDLFLSKLNDYGYSVEDIQSFPHFKTHSSNNYLVDNKFPRLISSSIPYKEIIKVAYSISLNGITSFMEVERVNN